MPFARIGEVDLFYTDEGTGGPPILFVHGFSCDSHDWMWQLPHFTRSHRVIALDLRGHGRSSVPAGGYEPKTFAADIAGLLRQLECGPVVAIGHSLGGVIVSALAVEHPELVSAVVSVDPGYLIADDSALAMQSIRDALKADPVSTSQALLSRSYSPASPPHLNAWHMRRIAGVPGEVLFQTLSNLGPWRGARSPAPICAAAPVPSSPSTPMTSACRWRPNCSPIPAHAPSAGRARATGCIRSARPSSIPWWTPGSPSSAWAEAC